MNLIERKQAFILLGKCLNNYCAGKRYEMDTIAGFGAFEQLNKAVRQAYADNNWFIEPNVLMAVKVVANNMLDAMKLNDWLAKYPDLPDNTNVNKRIGIIMAGNIPLVGFHDLLCVLLCGYMAVIKTSSKDNVLIHAVIDLLCKIEPRFRGLICYVNERPADIDMIISTGSNNSARYFKSWYGSIPHIIRKNRSSVAILTGNETESDLKLLGKDIFSYFGLGCRNVSTLFVPDNYDFDLLLSALSDYLPIFEHRGYNDCFRYQKAIMEMESLPYHNTGFLLMRNSVSLSAPIALVNYQKYSILDEVKIIINTLYNEIQCIVYQHNDVPNTIKFGQTQFPQLDDYADGVDTLKFLIDN